MGTRKTTDRNAKSEDKRSSIIAPIVVGIVIALVAGGTAPWWWSMLFPSKQHVATTSSLVLLPRTTEQFPHKWPLDDGQISVVINPPTTPGVGVNVEIHGPTGGPFEWENVPPRTVKRAPFGTTTYLIHILEVDSQLRTAQIMVAKQRQ